MLNNGNDIEYIKGLVDYLPESDIENLRAGKLCWQLKNDRFRAVEVLMIGIDTSRATYGLRAFDVGTCDLYSDKTLAEAIEELAIDESKKKNESLKKEPEFNVVTKPKHYMLFPEYGIEVRNLVEVLLNRASANGYSSPMFLSDQAQMLQYILRFDVKNGVEDLEKARWYLDKMIESLSN